VKALIIAAAAIGALVLVATASGEPSGPKAILIRAGKRYRVKATLVAPLSQLQVTALAVSMQAVGFSAVKIEAGNPKIEYTTPVQTTDVAITVGQVFALPGGQSVRIDSLTEVV